MEQLLAVIIIPVAYGSILSFLVAVAIAVPSPKYRKAVIYGLGGMTAVLAVVPYINEIFMPLRYLSLLHYLDLIGLIILGYQLEQLCLLLVLTGVFVISIAFINYYSDKMVLLLWHYSQLS
ncbi:MAG: hypothetical protein ACFFD4_22635 [Candidatus Odinarchaeota archaeon]